MPIRGGRSGGGSRGGSRAPRTSSSSGSRGFRIPLGNRTPRSTSSTGPSDQTPFRPLMSPRRFGFPGLSWKLIAIILGIILLAGCAFVALTVILPALGFG